jgi:hypothetical protein
MWLWPNLRHYSEVFMEGATKIMKKFYRNKSPKRDVNPQPPEYEEAALNPYVQ